MSDGVAPSAGEDSQSAVQHIGVVGGGQLAALLADVATAQGVAVTVLDPTPGCPACAFGAQQIVGDLFDESGLRQLIERVDVTTVDLEHVHTDALAALANEGHSVVPAPDVLAIIANKLDQKRSYAANGLPTSRFEALPYPSAALIRSFGLPAVQKAERGGYDGRGVALLRSEADLENLLAGPSFVEAYVPHEMEIGIIVGVDAAGNSCTWAATEMHFNPDGNLLDYLVAPARIDDSIAQRAQELALRAVKAINGVGIFGVEMFLSADGELLINEMAPRTHNSGHYTIDACETSQFEQQLRILRGLPLTPTTQTRHAAMVNLLGAPGYTGATVVEGADGFADSDDVHVHMYGKLECRHLRKMGHLTALGNTVEQALERARHAASRITIRGEDSQ